MTTALGNGVYTYGETARLLGVSRGKVNAWFTGWKGGATAILKRDYEDLTAEPFISFLDLIDASVAVAFRKKGVSLQTVRKLHHSLRQQLSTIHPFSHQEWFTNS